MRRFFVQPELLGHDSAVISGDLFRHIAGVLRLQTGDSFIMADGDGHEAVATITSMEKDRAAVDLTPSVTAERDQPLAITLYQGMPKGEKLDLILQKSTELGATRITPFSAERSVVRLNAERLDKRISRWGKIVQEAARQSGRSSIPSIGYCRNLPELLREEESQLKLFLGEDETERGLRELFTTTARPASVAVIVGPEGGLSNEEAAAATAAGFIPVSLGSRILRTETAGLAVIAILQYLWGDLG
jgi:16S rRNA (uracil1498-N3)-methyltransferase